MASTDAQLNALVRRASIEKLPPPVVILGVAYAESEDGVGQLLALPVARMNANQDCPVVASFDVPGVELCGVHGGGGMVGGIVGGSNPIIITSILENR